MDINHTVPIDWETLAEIISEGKCVLFLGPGATVNYSEKDRQNQFFMGLLKNHPAEIHSYHQEDGFFVFSKNEAIYDISIKVRKFYKEDYSSPMLEKLAQIPFHFVVLLSPDTALQTEMARQGFPYTEDYYDTINEHTPALPTPNTPPLIYHLLGISHKAESLIVSHGEMYNYMRAFLGGTKLPQTIKTAINFQNAKNLIFLGVDFNKWYFQLMLNMLGIDTNNYNSYASIQSGATGLRTIWEKHFHINFVPHEIDEFVDKLHQYFLNKKQLRQLPIGQHITRSYRIANFSKFLTLAFSGTDLDNFCLSYFDSVYDDFTPEQGKSARINKLIEYVRQQEQYEKLLGLMEDENPIQFKKNEPYFE
jgi:hypothetical protein